MRTSQPELRDTFLRRLGSRHQFYLLFDNIPRVYFFVKDIESRMILGSRPLLNRLGMENPDDIIGKTDFDFFPRHVAENFIRDDQAVIASGQPLINHLELWYNDQRMLEMFMTQKHPVFASDGQVIGVMGTVQNYEHNKQQVIPYAAVIRVVDYIREHYGDRIKVPDLADLAGISTRQLNRRFVEVFGISVQNFLIKTRIQASCDALLNGDKSIADIAIQVGFCDQSAFTQHFRKHIGVTPYKYRSRSGCLMD
ncbi:helix-turn-helix domain-containing protein [Planctomycetes bacterium K23_9]|uniref:Exoenzyme S synthesis regulatory protein ExsA n=1 Tax=Stieleria marina TaxID=1930275 RepID=A0A517P0C8_9BACT|nr:Exoenzyme S synthesis regulatory protein ExsA [Planctomycetes bacterium K23_9]